MIAIEQLRVRVGLLDNDASRDADILIARSYAQGIVEEYLDRWLDEGTYTEEFIHITQNTVSLKAYPIIAITSVQREDGSDIEYHIDARNGIVHFDGFVRDHRVVVVYDGGYGVQFAIPGGVEMAILMMFDHAWETFIKVAGSSSVGGGVIKSIQSDGARVDFDVSGDSGSGAGIDPGSGILYAALGLLRLFRRELC